MRRSRPKHIEGVGRTVVIFLIRVKSCGVVNENILGCTELARMYSEKHVLSRMSLYFIRVDRAWIGSIVLFRQE